MATIQRRKRGGLNRIAFIGSYVPRQCGIATFTAHLSEAVVQANRKLEVFAVPVNDLKEGYAYPPRVWFEIAEREVASYRRAADFLNINSVDVVCLQHEFGIYGGPAGSHILVLLRDLRMPVVTTLHTILQEPDPNERAVMEELVERSDRLVVMSERGVTMLQDIYGVSPDQIDLIPHGIPDVSFIDPSFYKDQFGVEGRNVLLTFGLLGPGKGLEHGIEALPAILDRHPDTVYIILGATHPTLKRQQGEIYRLGLQTLARELGVEGSVLFHNRFVSDEELNEFVGAADIYLTPYPNLAQVVSGTLAYALGAGKAVVSTPYWHAEELLAENRGVLVPVGDSQAIAEAIIDLLDEPTRRDAIRKRAYLLGRDMIWPKAARHYLEAFEQAREIRLHRPRPAFEATTLDKRPGELPLLKLDHLQRMTDSTGMLQHATSGVPNYSEGYTTDDNARALLFATLVEETSDVPPQEISPLASRYMAFLQYAFNDQERRFRNFLAYDRRWLEEVGSEDSHGRALRALGTVVARWQQQGIREWAGKLFEAALPPVLQFNNPRAWAFTLMGLDEYLTRYSGDRIAEDARRVLADRLLGLYETNSAPDWPWFEDTLTYSNAKLPHALLISGRSLSRQDMIDTALETLGWLAELQHADEGHFVPIGNRGFYPRGGERARFDQQPIEAHGMVSACMEAYRTTGDERWKVEAQLAFDWYVGRNDLRSPIYDPRTGGCCDGLEPNHVNPNEGAESTLAFLLSLVEMRRAEQALETTSRQLVEVVTA